MRYLLLILFFTLQAFGYGANANDLQENSFKKELTSIKSSSEERSNVEFRYQGQYFDEETELCYNRYRYYSPDSGTYISQDPIGLMGNNPNMYGYVFDSNTEVDVFGLHCSKKLAKNMKANGVIRPDDSIAHHMVGSGKSTKPAKDIIEKHGIHIDSHKNGVFLPDGPNSKAPGHKHTGRHTDAYIDAVNKDIIRADKLGGKKGVEKQLEKIRKGLLDKSYTPLQH